MTYTMGARFHRRRNNWGRRSMQLNHGITNGFPQKVVDLSAIRGSESNNFAMYLVIVRARTYRRYANSAVTTRFKRRTR